jgi:dipeptidase E
MVRYYCSGFDLNNIFGHGLGNMIKSELKNTKSIVYIPGDMDKIEKYRKKYITNFTSCFKKIGIEFDDVILITPEMSSEQAQAAITNASFVILMGGNPFKQKEICKQLNIMDTLKKYDGVMLGVSAGAMLMSKYIIITPCSDEYPDFHIEPGLNLDGISIYPHNNTDKVEYPDELVAGDEVYKKSDLIQVAKQYGKFYLLQDNQRDNGMVDVSVIKSCNGNIEFYTENEGKIWEVNKDVNLLIKTMHQNKMLKTMGTSKEY